MGVNLKALTSRESISLEALKNRILIVDGYNILYQFLTTIRTPDGTPLRDKEGRITSHLIGLFYRTTRLMQHGIKLAFVFDGTPPDLKRKTLDARKATKLAAKEAYEKAKEEEDIEAMKKYSSRTSRLTKEMVEEAKVLLDCLGIPYVQAPSEGEAQMAWMVKNGDGWAGVSQDYDSLLYGCPRIIFNLNIQGKRKMPGSPRYITVTPELVTFKGVLEELELDLDQLMALSMLVGTDYNPKGIKGIGPKKGLKLVKEHDHDFAKLFEDIEFSEKCGVEWEEIWNVFHDMPVEKEYDLKWGTIDAEGIMDYLVGDRGFSEDRVMNTLEKLDATKKVRQQTSLGDFG